MSKKKLSRREFLHIASMTAGGVVLAGCGPQATPTPEEQAEATDAPTEAPTAKPEVYEILHWSWLGASDAEVWHQLIDQYNEAHTDTQVVIQDVPSDQYATKILATAATGQAPDFGNDTGGSRAEWVTNDVIIPVGGHLSEAGLDLDDFVDVALADCRYPLYSDEETLWHMPVDINSFQMEINTEHAEEAGLDLDNPPQTGEEVIEWAKATTTYDGDKVDRSGFLLTGSGLHVNQMLYIAAHQMGFRVLSEDYKQVAVNPEAAIEAGQWVLDLFDKHKVGTRDVTDRYKTFGTGGATMFITGPWTLSGYLDAGLPFMSVLCPAIGDEQTTQHSVGILSMYAQEDESRYARTAEALTWISDNSWLWVTVGRGAAPRQSVLDNPEYYEAGLPQKVRGAFLEGVEIATQPRYKLKAGPELVAYTDTNIVHKTLDPAWLGDKEFEPAFNELVAEWTKIIDEEMAEIA